MKLDDTNKAIIKQLRDGRKAYSAIAEAIGITENTVRTRVNRMIEEGLIEISALVDPSLIPEVQVVIMGVKLKTMDLEEKAREFMRLRGVNSVQVVTGRYDLIVQLVTSASSDQSLLAFFKHQLSRIRDVSDVETFVVYQSHNYRIPYNF